MESKKPIFKRTWFIVLAVIFGLALLGSLISNDQSIPEGTGSSGQSAGSGVKGVSKETKKSLHGKLKEWYSSGDFQYRVSRVKRVRRIRSAFHTFTDDFLIVNIDLHNPTKKTEKVDISGSTMKIATLDGYTYKPIKDVEITQSLNKGSSYNYLGNFDTIQPETYHTAVFGFRIPRKKKGLVLSFREGVFSKEIKVKLD